MLRSEGTIYGEGIGWMTTKDGELIHLRGNDSAKSIGPDGSVEYLGTIHFQTALAQFASLNGAVGVHEYDVGADGNTSVQVWEWK